MNSNHTLCSFHWHFITLPWQLIGLVGTALAFIVGFKNNASYDRIWEARKIWGGIVNTSRSLTIMVNDFITKPDNETNKRGEELFAIRKQIIMRHVAWMTTLRHALRIKKPWETFAFNKSDKEYISRIKIREYTYSLEEELQGYLSEEELKEVLSKNNKATAVLTIQSRHFKALFLEGKIDNFRHVEIENQLVELFALQGQSERIKNFPYPRQFATLNTYFVWVFIFLLPLGAIAQFDEIGKSLAESSLPFIQFIGNYFIWLAVPVTTLISWIFLLMERIGDVTENPFEGGGNDIPITSMSRGIEIDIREMIGDDPNEIPKQHPITFDTQM
ncbi:bestrophin family ion channel [Niabella ginsengisoli]|nr:bestrophin family ion channel [Niabella ginsengisoli]